MGKKRVSVLGSEDEAKMKAKKAIKLEQKKLREGQEVRKPEDAASPVTPSVEPAAAPVSEEKKAAKRIHVRSKQYLTAKKLIDVEKTYPLADGLQLLRQVSFAKFDPTVELHITLKDKGFSREVELPHSTGKTRIVAIADDATIAQIETGKVNFDILLANPAQMAKLVKFAKVLGPKGLMPNPKNGTLVNDPETAAAAISSKNSVPLKTEKDAPVVHTSVGKLSASDKNLTENISAVLSVFTGTSVKKIVLKSTISPAIKIQA
jgi:large subunit ribosomal protein L1